MSDDQDNSLPDVDDETFLSIMDLNFGDGYVEAVVASDCGCPRCKRTRRIISERNLTQVAQSRALTLFKPQFPKPGDVPQEGEPLVAADVERATDALDIKWEPPSEAEIKAFIEELLGEGAEFVSMKEVASNAPRDPLEKATDAQRKAVPVASGVFDYFPDALIAVAHVSHNGNEKHNPGQPMFWNRSKSGDEADALLRHFMARGTFDKEGNSHTAMMAWRALALLQKEIEEAFGSQFISRGSRP